MNALTGPTSIALDLSATSRPFGDTALARGLPQGWDFLGNVPVPLRHRVRDGVAELMTQHRAGGGAPLKCCFPMGQGGRGPIERLRTIRSLADYPNMLVSADHPNSFNRRFFDRHVRTGAFSACQPDGTAAVFTDCGLVDPCGWIGVFAVAPFVLLIDHRRLDGLPAPRRWADLFDPSYRGQVVFGGWRREGERCFNQFNKFFLLCIAREFGLDALARLVRNVPTLLHSAQMPRLAGTDASPGGIYVLPWLLADMCPRRTDTAVVWPEDGALAYPLWLTVKSDQHATVDPLIRYFYGAGLGQILDENHYPALNPDRPPALPPASRLKWLGWDYVRHRATAQAVKQACRTFLDNFDDSAPSEVRSCA
ncbi:MAG: ABC transporter substrate-binding protein [Azospirillaceae bacterium]|nr:ABC transporter substrate-binding protein [Azospirillaceae bacterium]